MPRTLIVVILALLLFLPHFPLFAADSDHNNTPVTTPAREIHADPSSVGTLHSLVLRDPGNFATSTADLFLGHPSLDNTSGTTTTPQGPRVRAVHPYDMRIDPVGRPTFDRGQKFTSYDESVALRAYTYETDDRQHFQRDRFFGRITRFPHSEPGDPVLFIDYAAFYDDSEGALGGWWANFKLRICPAVRKPLGYWVCDREYLGPVPLRGPFWSGEKLEVGDTDHQLYSPQIMYYKNFGIWNWKWAPHADAVLVFVVEGDGWLGEDRVACFLVRKNDTLGRRLVLSDRGQQVALGFLPDNRLQRTVVSQTYPDGTPHIARFWDEHNIDIAFRTDQFHAHTPPPLFEYVNVIGPIRVRGESQDLIFPYTSITDLGNGPTLAYIDNVSYCPGWDWSGARYAKLWWIDPDNNDDDFAFRLEPHSDDVTAHTAMGNDKTVLSFRASKVSLPEYVTFDRSAVLRVHSSGSYTWTAQVSPSERRFLFSELLSYWTAGDDDFAFRIDPTSSSSFQVSTNSYDNGTKAYVDVRFNTLHWPACAPAVVRQRVLFAPYGTAHATVDIPIPYPDYPYMIVNEITHYVTDHDDDLSWTVEYERFPHAVRFQLASSGSWRNPANHSAQDQFVQSTASILQFPVDLGLPVAHGKVSPDPAECTSYSGGRLFLDASASKANRAEGVSVDDLKSVLWQEDAVTIAEGLHSYVWLRPGSHDLALRVQDECGNSAETHVVARVVDTTPPTGGITAPAAGACIGADAVPVRVKDDFSDSCYAELERRYEPAGGPLYADHGDHHVVVTAADGSGNWAADTVDFVIDLVPPKAWLREEIPMEQRIPRVDPLGAYLGSTDEDGATGGVVWERLLIDGCPVLDGNTDGDGDGLLQDEDVTIGGGLLCLAYSRCGVSTLEDPVLTLLADDCGGNTGRADRVVHGKYVVNPALCDSQARVTGPQPR